MILHNSTFADAMAVLSGAAVLLPTGLVLVQVPDGDPLDTAHMGASASGMLDAFSSLDLQQQPQRRMHPWQHQQQRREAGVTPRLAESLPRRAATAGLHWEQHRRQRTAAARWGRGIVIITVMCMAGQRTIEHKHRVCGL